jgi:tetratricopeptide (TPR) repeat protein
MIKYNRIIFVFMTIIIMLCFFPLGAQDKESLKETAKYVEQGKELYENKNYYAAVEVLTEVLKLDPWNNEAKILLEKSLEKIEELTGRLKEGFESLDEGDVDKAYESFLFVKDNSSPKTEDLYDLLAGGFNSIEKMKNMQVYEKIIEKGDGFLDQEEYDSALEVYTFAVKFYPEGELASIKYKEADLAKTVHGIRLDALHFFREEKLEESKIEWTNLLDIQPEDEEAQIYLSKILFKQGERERLAALAKSYFDNGVILFNSRQYEESIDQFENSIALNYRVQESKDYIERAREALKEKTKEESGKMSVDVARYLREGIKQYNLEQYKKALSVLNEGLLLDPENTQIQEYIIRATIALKREEEKSVSPFSPFYKLIQDLMRLGDRAYATGKYEDSIKFWEEILLIFPFNERARLGMTRTLKKTDPSLATEILADMFEEAKSYSRREKKREAMAKLKLILDVDPRHREARALLKDLEEEDKKKEERKVVSREDRKQAQELYDEGVRLYGKEKLKEALQAWKKALELNPEFDEARVYLARAETQLRTLEKIGAGPSEETTALSDEMRIKLKKHYLEGINYYMSGLYKEAISEWEEIIKIDPNYENVEQNIIRAKNRLNV